MMIAPRGKVGRRPLQAVGIALAGALSLSACSSSESASTASDGAATGEGAAAADSGRVTVATPADWPGMDPGTAVSGVSMVVQNQVFEGLLGRDRLSGEVPPPIVPSLAEEWTVSGDGRVYTFELRKGVVFHDGAPFNAEAVAFNFRRWMDEEFEHYFDVAAGNTSVVTSTINEVRPADEYTVEIQLDSPDQAFIDRLTGSPFYYFVSPAAVEEYGNDGQLSQGVGTGPFRVAEYRQGEFVVLEPFENYWGEPARAEQLVFRPISEESARTSALQSGEIDIAMEVGPDSLALLEGNEQMTAHLPGKPATFTLQLNVQEPPFDDPDVRRAVSMAINREAIVADLLRGAGEPGGQFYGIGSPAHDESLGAQDAYDPDGAKELLESAGYANGFETEFHCAPAGTGVPATDLIMETIQSDLGAVGIEVSLDMSEWNSYVSKWLQGIPAGEGIGAFCMAIGHDDAALIDLYAHSRNVAPDGFNAGGYKSEDVDMLIEEARASEDFDAYLATLQKAAMRLREDRPHIYIFHDAGPWASGPGVTGWEPVPSWLQDFRHAKGSG